MSGGPQVIVNLSPVFVGQGGNRFYLQHNLSKADEIGRVRLLQ
jgi:hypothetical protein